MPNHPAPSPKRVRLLAAILFACAAPLSAAGWVDSPRTFEDPRGDLRARDVLARADGWISHPDDWTPSFGLSRSTYWIARTWRTSPGDTSRWTLVVRSSVIDTLDVHTLVDGTLDGPRRFGDRLPYATRAVAARQFATPVHPGRDGRILILLRASSHDGLHESVPFEIVETARFQNERVSDGFWYGIYSGVLLLLATLSVLLYPVFRDTSQLAFAGYSTSFCAWNFVLLGFGDELLWPERPVSNAWIMASVLAFGIFLPLFTQRFLRMRERMPRMRRAMFAILAAGAVPALPFALLDRYRDFFVAILAMFLLQLPLLLAAGFVTAWRGHAQGWIFLASWTPGVVGALLLIGKVLGVLPAWRFVEHAYLYGTIFHTVVLSLGATVRLITVQRKANSELETLVHARTHDLEEANHRLEELSATDFLTGLPNRRRFLERYDAVCHDQRSGRSPMTIVLLDVDHFKAYNDRLGHLAGDACLQDVARSLQASLRRGSDFCARFGGEEFVLCLVNTPLEEGIAVAERVRENLQSCALPHPASPASEVVTVSLGVAGGTIGSPLEDLLRRADASLYEAKRSGRNRVGPAG